DPLVWDRARALAMFGFDYRIECYTPAPKRRYGYFTLPILRRGQLIGRLDPKAHRKDGRFEGKALHLEPGIRVTGGLVGDIGGAAVGRMASSRISPGRCVSAPHGMPRPRLRCAGRTRQSWRRPFSARSMERLHRRKAPGSGRRKAQRLRASDRRKRMHQSRNGTVEINGASLAYETMGAGRPLVMLHGHLLDQHQWDD